MLCAVCAVCGRKHAREPGNAEAALFCSALLACCMTQVHSQDRLVQGESPLCYQGLICRDLGGRLSDLEVEVVEAEVEMMEVEVEAEDNSSGSFS